jgi:hypothetical protein
MSQPASTLVGDRSCWVKEHLVIITNADRALELAEEPGGLRIWAALCVSFAAGTTRTVISARKVLEDIPLPDLRGAAQSLLTELAEDPATAARVAAAPKHARTV